MALRRPVALVAALLLAACGFAASGHVYDETPREVRQRLPQIDPPYQIFGSAVTDSRVVNRGDGSVMWTLIDADRLELLQLIASVGDAGGSRSRVAVSVQPPAGKYAKRVGQGIAQNPAIVRLYRRAMEEQIDAGLNGHEFRMAAIQAELAAAAVVSMPRMASQLDEAAKQSAAEDRRNFDHAYHLETHGGFPEENAAEPVD